MVPLLHLVVFHRSITSDLTLLAELPGAESQNKDD